MWRFWYRVVDLLQEELKILTSLLEAWWDAGVNREDMMLSNLIDPGLENNENEMEDLKVDNIEEDQASVLIKKTKNEKYDASINTTQKNNDTVDKEEKSKEKVND